MKVQKWALFVFCLSSPVHVVFAQHAGLLSTMAVRYLAEPMKEHAIKEKEFRDFSDGIKKLVEPLAKAQGESETRLDEIKAVLEFNAGKYTLPEQLTCVEKTAFGIKKPSSSRNRYYEYGIAPSVFRKFSAKIKNLEEGKFSFEASRKDPNVKQLEGLYSDKPQKMKIASRVLVPQYLSSSTDSPFYHEAANWVSFEIHPLHDTGKFYVQVSGRIVGKVTPTKYSENSIVEFRDIKILCQ